jgi:osmoprotectant transport system ATP-binding protein
MSNIFTLQRKENPPWGCTSNRISSMCSNGLSFVVDYVNIRNVTYRLDGKDILRNINAAFAEKKVTAIIGKSGSGKSTLIRLINGLIRPSAGAISLHGEPIDYKNLREVRKAIGYAIQGIGLFPHLTIEENICLPGRVHAANRPGRDHFLEVARLVNLPEDTFGKYPHELSGGEQQRAGISRALFLDPPLLLMDEPFGSLDPITRYEVHEEFLRLQRLVPRTVLIVTHDLREAQKLADDILVIDQGSAQQFDSASEIFRRPATDAVINLIRTAGL